VKLNFKLDDLRVFCVAARKASFAAAATELGMSPAFVSKRIALLERALGVTLFHRAARRVTVTDDGERVYASAQQIFQGVDLDVRVGDVDEPHLVAHRIADSSRVLCAVPAYLERRGTPASVAELAQHDCLVLRDRHQSFGVWRLAGPQGAAKVKVTGRLSSNNAEILRGWANDGHGILLASRWDVHADMAAGRLAPVLPAWSQSADLWAASTVRLSHSAKVRVCARFLQKQLASGPFALAQ
jgi:LysR family transcriptional activator of dmlA